MGKTKTAEHSKNYRKVKGYYELGLWGPERVERAVGKWITEAEYNEITGMVFPGEEG